MKRTPLARKTPLKPGKGFAPRSVPMARTSPLRTTKPLQRGTSQLKSHKPIARSTKPMSPVGQRAKRLRQGKVAPNAAEQAWMDKARAFGCIVCHLHHNAPNTPAVIHHILQGGRRMGHLYTIPLCDPGHHQHSPTPAKISRHPHKARFESTYGPELELLATLQLLLGM